MVVGRRGRYLTVLAVPVAMEELTMLQGIAQIQLQLHQELTVLVHRITRPLNAIRMLAQHVSKTRYNQHF